MRVRFTLGARRQIAAIHAYIAAESPSGADSVVARIEEIAEMLGQHPKMGRKLPVGRLYRFPVRPYPYLIYYTVSGSEVRIVRVRHSARYRAAFHESEREFRV